MTINEYLQNPYGKGSSFSNFKDQKVKLENTYNELSSKFACKIYKHQNNIIFHVIVPSSNKDFLSYDVLLEINYDKKTSSEVDANNIDFKCFSNCPSFIFTYANAFRKNNLICRWLENKYRPEVKKNNANIKNQYGIIGLEKSLYLACLYLKKSMRTRDDVIITTSKKVTSYSAIASGVRSQDEIMEKSKLKIKPDELKGTSGVKDINFKSKNRESTRRGNINYVKTTNSTLFTQSSSKSKKSSKSHTTKKTKRF